MQRATGGAIKHDDRLALIGQTQRYDLLTPGEVAAHQIGQHGEGVLPNFLRVMFDPTRLRIVLAVLPRLAVEGAAL